MSNSCDPLDYSLPGSSVHEISQARILEWVAISFLALLIPSNHSTLAVVTFIKWLETTMGLWIIFEGLSQRHGCPLELVKWCSPLVLFTP